MQRRRFVQMLTLAGAGIAALETTHAVQTTTVSYRVKGFSCPTCAVGLETMLGGKKGVKWVKATYPEALVVIKYDASSVSEPTLKGYISELGFTAEEVDTKS